MLKMLSMWGEYFRPKKCQHLQRFSSIEMRLRVLEQRPTSQQHADGLAYVIEQRSVLTSQEINSLKSAIEELRLQVSGLKPRGKRNGRR